MTSFLIHGRVALLSHDSIYYVNSDARTSVTPIRPRWATCSYATTASEGTRPFFLTGVGRARDEGVAGRAGTGTRATGVRGTASRCPGASSLTGLNASVDFFIRTSDEGHKAFVRDFLQRIYDNGGRPIRTSYAGFLLRSGARRSSPRDELTADGLCPIPPDEGPSGIEETNYFFRLSAYQDTLLALYDAQPDLVLPGFRFKRGRRSFIAGGLQDFSILAERGQGRGGIPFAWDESQVAYVWGRRAPQLPERAQPTRARRAEDLARRVLACGWPHLLAKGHPAFPLRVLAGDASLGRIRGTEAAVCARLSPLGTTEDLQVGRKTSSSRSS